MELKNYFESVKGIGILSTADSSGKVDAAIYSRPHFLEDELVFIMRDKLSHRNLVSNPQAVYLFIEEGPGYKGKRLYLTMVKEEKNSKMIESLKRSKRELKPGEDRFLVFFKLDQVRPLVGDGDQDKE